MDIQVGDTYYFPSGSYIVNFIHKDECIIETTDLDGNVIELTSTTVEKFKELLYELS